MSTRSMCGHAKDVMLRGAIPETVLPGTRFVPTHETEYEGGGTPGDIFHGNCQVFYKGKSIEMSYFTFLIMFAVIFTLSTLHSFEAVGSSFHLQTMWLGILKSRAQCAFNAPKIIASGALTPKLTGSTSGAAKLGNGHEKCLVGPPGEPTLISGLTCH